MVADRQNDTLGAAGFCFDPSSPQFIEDPYATYQTLRDHYPAYFSAPHNLWLITRYSDIAQALSDPGVWSSSRGNVVVDSAVRVGRSLGTLDPPRHDELRAIVNKGVTPARIRALLPEARDHARALIKVFQSRRAVDLVSEFSRPILNRALARLIGLDEQNAGRGAELVEEFLDTGDVMIGPVGKPESAARLFEFLRDQLRRRESAGPVDPNAEDFFSVLISAKQRGASLSDEEIAANMMTVLTAGSASVVHFFGNLMRALWLHPEQKRVVSQNPALIDAAIEEAVRWDTSTQCFARQVMRDTEIAGVRIPANSRALLFYASANRDERAFEDPDRFDIHRKRVRHLGFGSGPHLCMGTSTARQLCRVLLEELLPVIGDFEIEMGAAVRTKFIMFRGFQRLPIRF